jgi:hypothetical protein
MPLIADKIQLTDFFRNGNYITFPVAYIAYIDSNGYIRNIKGDVYTKMKSANKITSLKIPEIDPDYYYDIIRTNIILDCKDRIINPKTLVFLVNNTLYDIFGREIKPLLEQEIPKEDIKEVIEQDAELVETDEKVECNFIYCPFENSIIDSKNNVAFFINGNESYEENAFVFDGNTYLQANKPYLTDNNEWTLMISIKQEQVQDEYQSIICFSKDGENLFNILVEKYDIYVYANEENTFIDDLEDKITSQFNKIVVTSKGDVYINGIFKKNVGEINLTDANWNFILGGDYNTDGSVNNYYIGLVDEFGVCDYIVNDNVIKGIE